MLGTYVNSEYAAVGRYKSSRRYCRRRRRCSLIKLDGHKEKLEV